MGEKKRSVEPHSESQNETRVDTDSKESVHSGVRGIYEKFLRSYRNLAQLVTTLPLYLFAAVCIGVALFPAVHTFRFFHDYGSGATKTFSYFMTSLGISFGFFVFGFSLAVVVPVTNWLFRVRPKAWRGPYYSLETVPWYIHNGLLYLVRYTFLEFMTPTPFNILFFKSMGMKIGTGTHINTSNISDPCLIELGDKVTIGGSVTIVAHYGVGGFLILAPVKVEKGATIGLKASVMGGVHIGEGAKILPHSVVLPKTIIPAGETWGGVPAQKIENKTAAA